MQQTFIEEIDHLRFRIRRHFASSAAPSYRKTAEILTPESGNPEPEIKKFMCCTF